MERDKGKEEVGDEAAVTTAKHTALHASLTGVTHG